MRLIKQTDTLLFRDIKTGYQIGKYTYYNRYWYYGINGDFIRRDSRFIRYHL